MKSYRFPLTGRVNRNFDYQNVFLMNDKLLALNYYGCILWHLEISLFSIKHNDLIQALQNPLLIILSSKVFLEDSYVLNGIKL